MLEVHLYKLSSYKQHLERYGTYLSSDEIEKAKRFIVKDKGDNSIICRALLREHLSRHLNCSPQEVEFSYGRYGKPSLKNEELHFNISHSQEMCALILSQGSPVGIDIEQINPKKDIHKLSTRVFTVNEQAHFQSLNNDLDKRTFFFTNWTQKEAITKTQGMGLVRPFSDIDISHYNLQSTIISDYALSYCIDGSDELATIQITHH